MASQGQLQVAKNGALTPKDSPIKAKAVEQTPNKDKGKKIPAQDQNRLDAPSTKIKNVEKGPSKSGNLDAGPRPSKAPSGNKKVTQPSQEKGNTPPNSVK